MAEKVCSYCLLKKYSEMISDDVYGRLQHMSFHTYHNEHKIEQILKSVHVQQGHYFIYIMIICNV